jgi:DNA-binding CsgD family transcriptional regulator/tetratricopeptide (TPR) repeat protein
MLNIDTIMRGIAMFGSQRQPISPVLVGREAELGAIKNALAGALGGKGQCLLIAGEAGIGKSRLIAQAQELARNQQMRTLQGHTFEQDTAFPYAPLIDLLRTCFAYQGVNALHASLGSSASEIVKLLPELAATLPDVRPSARLEPEAEKRRLFEALAHFLTRLAQETPLFIVIEDIHWSDEASLEFLHFFAHRMDAHPILLVASYRSEEVSPQLRHLLAHLDRERLTIEVALRPLALVEVDAMLRAVFNLTRPAGTDFLEALYELTEGNPFFIEEVLASLLAAGEIFYTGHRWDRKPLAELRIPRSVQDTVARRLESLSLGTRQVATLAAVAGQRFDFTLLQHLTEQDENVLLGQIKELIATQLVVETSAEHFSFRHALTRQAIYTTLLTRERRALHRRLAGTLERLGDVDTRLGELAYHYYEAGVWDKALTYAKQAGEQAQSLYAPRATLEHLSRALEAAVQLKLAPPPEVLRARGHAYRTLGDFELAQADYEAAQQNARAAGDHLGEWWALLDLGKLWASRNYTRTGDYFTRALALAREMDDPTAVAHSLNRVGNWHLNLERPQEAHHCHQKALEIFRELEDPKGVPETLDLLGMASYLGGDLLGGTRYFEQAVARFRELDDRRNLISSLATMAMRGGTYQTNTMVAAEPLAATLYEGEEALALARAISWRSGEAYAMIFLSFSLGAQGVYGRALELAQQGLALAETIEHRQWMTAAGSALGALSLDLLDLTEAQRQLEEALSLAREIGSLHWIRTASGFLASTYITRGDLAQAQAVLDAALSTEDAAQTLGQRLAWCARAELALARGEPHVALHVTGKLAAFVASEGGAPLRLRFLRGEILMALQDLAEAEKELRVARDVALALGAKPLLWRIHLALARLYAAQARSDKAELERVAAQVITDSLADAIPDGRVRSHFLHEATAIIPTSYQRADDQTGGLTARELEVAGLIAQGKTNRELATLLQVSERTVETHVGNILSKLGFKSRTQIAVWAVNRTSSQD